MTAKKIEGYWGSLADSDVDGLNNLKEDYVEYFTVDKDIDTMLYDDEGNELYEYSLIHGYAEGVNAYGVFLGGDQPLIVSKNSDGNGKKITEDPDGTIFQFVGGDDSRGEEDCYHVLDRIIG